MEIPDGKYRGKAQVSAAPLIESGKGTPGISVEMVISSGDQTGMTLTWTGWLSDGAADRTIESLRYMGWTGTDLDQVVDLDKNEVELVVKGEEYEGNVYPRIQFINRIGGVMGAAMTQEKARSFSASMQSRIRAIDAAAGKGAGPARDTRKAAPQQQRQAVNNRGNTGGYDTRDIPPPDDSDIPF